MKSKVILLLLLTVFLPSFIDAKGKASKKGLKYKLKQGPVAGGMSAGPASNLGGTKPVPAVLTAGNSPASEALKTQTNIHAPLLSDKQTNSGSGGVGPENSLSAMEVALPGIETSESTYPLVRCTQTFGLDGLRIINMINYCERESAHLQMNIWTVNLFKDRNPSNLIDSIEWAHIDFPVRNFTGAPNCLKFASKLERKIIAFCLPTEKDLDPWLDVIRAIRYCRIGKDPSQLKKRCESEEEFGEKLEDTEGKDTSSLPSIGMQAISLNSNSNRELSSSCPGCEKS